jgi:hypothetical protein
MTEKPSVIDEAVEDANRTLAKKNIGYGFFVVTAIEVRWLAYDEERDGLFFQGGSVRREYDVSEREG